MESIENLRYYIDHGINHRDELIKLTDAIEREIAEKYMLLPVDALGVPIHVGDVVSLKGGEPFEVGGVRDTKTQWHVFPYDYQRWYAPLDLYHVEPNPIKELLEEFLCGYQDIVLSGNLNSIEAVCKQNELIDEYTEKFEAVSEE